MHCPACGYSLEGLETTVCPECGLADVFAAAQAKRRKELQQISFAFLIPAIFAVAGSVTRELDRLDLAPGADSARSADVWSMHAFSAWCLVGIVLTTMVRVSNIVLARKAQVALKIAATVPLGLFALGLLAGVLFLLGMALGLWGW